MAGKIFYSKLDAQGGNPTIKRKSLVFKLIELKES